MNTQTKNQENVILEILKNYTNVTVKQVAQLIEATNIGGVSFVSLKGYSSDKSGNTETADQLINIGASYQNMLKKDENIYTNFDLSKIDINKFDYSTIDTGKYNLTEFKDLVKKSLPIALEELNQPKAKKDTSNDIWLNKAIVFNTNTNRLAIFGQSVNKVVTEKGQYKVVKSAPKTIAKRLIEKQAKGKAQTLRRFVIDNFNGSIKLKNDLIEIG